MGNIGNQVCFRLFVFPLPFNMGGTRFNVTLPLKYTEEGKSFAERPAREERNSRGTESGEKKNEGRSERRVEKKPERRPEKKNRKKDRK